MIATIFNILLFIFQMWTSAKYVIRARMEPGVLTLLVDTTASVLQTTKESIVMKVLERALRTNSIELLFFL